MIKGKEKGNLYELAKLAKNRLRKNTYEEEKVVIPHKTSIMIMPKKEEKVFTPTIIVNNKEEMLYKKVCALISSGSLNPVGELIDSKAILGLDTEAKQKYIKGMAEKFKELKNRYFREQMLGSSRVSYC